MKLSIENIGYINKADIEIAGLTLIAGPNNTGKSTIGKVLYTVFNGLYNIDDQVEKHYIR